MSPTDREMDTRPQNLPFPLPPSPLTSAPRGQALSKLETEAASRCELSFHTFATRGRRPQRSRAGLAVGPQGLGSGCWMDPRGQLAEGRVRESLLPGVRGQRPGRTRREPGGRPLHRMLIPALPPGGLNYMHLKHGSKASGPCAWTRGRRGSGVLGPGPLALGAGGWGPPES